MRGRWRLMAMAPTEVDLLTAVGSTNGTRRIGRREKDRLTLKRRNAGVGNGNQAHKLRSDSGSSTHSKKGSARSEIAPGMG